MVQDPLLLEDDFDSALLGEAAKRLNFIYRLARRYRAPELLEFLDAVAEGLLRQEDFPQGGKDSRE